MQETNSIISPLPLYKQVSRALLAKIRSGEFSVGGKTPGERRIAEAMGVSRGTASLALKELSRCGYLERDTGRGTYVSSAKLNHLLNLTVVSTIQAISLKHQSYSNWIAMAGLYKGLQSACAKWNVQLAYRCSPLDMSKTEADRLASELSLANNALIITNDVPKTLRHALAAHGLLLFSSDKISSPPVHYVTYDRRTICQEAAAYLLSKGYRTCGILYNSPKSRNTVLKMEGFTSCTEHGQLSLLPQWILDLPNDNVCTAISEALAEKLPQNPSTLPDVFLSTTPVYSLELRKLAEIRGWHIPRDIAILGYGNDDNESFSSLPMTYIRIPYAEIGQEAVRLLDLAVRQRQKISASILPARLVIGQTT